MRSHREFDRRDATTPSPMGANKMYEPLSLSALSPLVDDRIADLLSTAAAVRGHRRSPRLRISWPRRPHTVAGHRTAGLGTATGQRA